MTEYGVLRLKELDAHLALLSSERIRLQRDLANRGVCEAPPVADMIRETLSRRPWLTPKEVAKDIYGDYTHDQYRAVQTGLAQQFKAGILKRDGGRYQLAEGERVVRTSTVESGHPLPPTPPKEYREHTFVQLSSTTDMGGGSVTLSWCTYCGTVVQTIKRPGKDMKMWRHKPTAQGAILHAHDVDCLEKTK